MNTFIPSGDSGASNATATPPPPQSAPQQSDQGGWQQAAASAAQGDQGSASPSGPAPAAPTAPAAPVQPTVIEPVKRGGLAGLMDGMADVLAGKTRPELGRDQDGNTYVKETTLTHGQQWARIGAQLVKGAAAGLAAGKGAGNMGKAALAGVQSGMQDTEGRQKSEQEAENQASKINLDRANAQMLRMQVAEQAWRATRLGVEATQHDIEFSQGQEDRLEKHGAVLLGTTAHAGDISHLMEKNPDLMKDLVKNNSLEFVPNYQNGKVAGFNVYKTGPGYRETMLPGGTVFHTFNPDTGQYIEHKASAPLTQGELDDYEAAASSAAAKFKSEQAENKLKAAQAKDTEARASEVPSEINRNNAAAEKDRSEKVTPNPGAPDETTKDIAAGLASGRYLMGKDIPLRTSKDQTTAAAYTKAANDYSMLNFGLPYSPEIIRQESKMAEAPHTQAFLTGIDRMLGTAGMPGQLDQVLDVAKRAGVGENAPLNEGKLWVKNHFGSEAAKNFQGAMSDTQTALGTLIGNPLLGSGESDLKLKTAQRQFGSDPTMKDLKGAVSTIKEILERARGELARNNRYIQERYGDQYSAAPVTVQIPGHPPGQVPARSVAQFLAENPGAQVVK